MPPMTDADVQLDKLVPDSCASHCSRNSRPPPLPPPPPAGDKCSSFSCVWRRTCLSRGCCTAAVLERRIRLPMARLVGSRVWSAVGDCNQTHASGVFVQRHKKKYNNKLLRIKFIRQVHTHTLSIGWERRIASDQVSDYLKYWIYFWIHNFWENFWIELLNI